MLLCYKIDFTFFQLEVATPLSLPWN